MASSSELGGDRFRYGCVLEFQIAEGKGSKCYDQSGYGNDGTIYGARWQKGPFFYALSFDGVDDHVEVPHSDSLNITKAITIEAWVKVSSFVNLYPVIVGKLSAYVSRFDALDTDKGRMMASWYLDGSWVHVYGATTINTGEWIHHVITFDSAIGTKMYLNGVLDKEDFATGSIGTSINPVLIGNYETYIRYLHGAIALIRIYERALSAEEIFALYSYLVSPTIRAPELGVS